MLQQFLCPKLTEEDKAKIAKIREQQKSMLESMGIGLDEDDYKDEKALPDGDDEDDDEKEDEEEDIEKEEDSDFQENISKIIDYSDLDQSLKGEDINFVG